MGEGRAEGALVKDFDFLELPTSLPVPQTCVGIAVLFRKTPPPQPQTSLLGATVPKPTPRKQGAPPPTGPHPFVTGDFLGQLVPASGGGMGWLSSTLQGLFTMADDLEQQPQGWLSSWLPAWRPTSMSQLKNVEARILQCLQNKFLARYVSLPNQNKIWTVTVSPEQKDRTPLVMVHGFGGGVGLWILNMDSLSARRTLHTFDLLGFGRSSRPTFPRDPEGAEDEFVTSIETWRETMGIPSMILLGHSLGGFLATSYSIKYPERVKHLILVDPWGFPLRPTDPSEIRAPPTWVKAVASILGRSNPLAVLRVAGPWGPGLVQRFRPDFKRKFADFFEDDTISEYIYHCNAQNPSGETAFKAMMESFGWARRPMLERIHLIRKDVPITMIYGANTWIDTSTGKKVKMQRPDSYVRDLEIEGASHHVYADQPHIFNTVVEEICDSVD